MDLHGHRLIVIDQSGLLLLILLDLLDQILSSGSLLPSGLAHGQALVRLNEFPLSVDDHCLELVSLPDQLLRVSIDLLL